MSALELALATVLLNPLTCELAALANRKKLPWRVQ